MRRFACGSVRLDLMQEERGLVEQALRRPRVLDDDRLGELPQPRLLVAASAPGPCRRSPATLEWRSSFLTPRAARSRVSRAASRSSTMQSNWRVAQLVERLVAGADRRRSRRRRRRRAARRCARADVVVLDDQQAADAPVDELTTCCSSMPRRAVLARPASARKRDAPPSRARAACASSARDDVHRDVARRGIVLEVVEHGQPVDVRQVDVEHDGVGLISVAGERQAVVAAVDDERREARARAPGRAAIRANVGSSSTTSSDAVARLIASRSSATSVGERDALGGRRSNVGGGCAHAPARREASRRGTRSLGRVAPARAVAGAAEAYAGGRYSVNVLPSPGALSTPDLAAEQARESREIDRPSPVPPYLRFVCRRPAGTPRR